MAEWQTALLDDLVEIIIDHRGKTPLKMGGNFIASGYPVLSAKNVKTDKLIEMDSIRYISGELYSKWMKDELFRNDIILTSEAPLGEVYLIPDDSKYALGQRLFGIRVKKDCVLPQYLSAWLASPQGQAALHSRATGTTAQGIKQSELRKVLIDLPPMPTQELIANTRSAIISKIDLNRQMNAVLESAARALFKSWFVDFDPVRAKMEGRVPDGLSADIAALFPNALVDSPFGEVPKGWAWSDLKSVALLNDESWTRRNYPDEIEYVDLANTKWGTIESTQIYTAAEVPSRAQRIIQSGDTIVGTVRPGNGSYAYVGRNGMTASTGFAALRPQKPHYSEFVFLVATSNENIERLAHLADGGAYPAVRPEVVMTTPAVWPGDSILAEFSKISRPLIQRIERNKAENIQLVDLRDTLLPKLISGQLEVA